MMITVLNFEAKTIGNGLHISPTMAQTDTHWSYEIAKEGIICKAKGSHWGVSDVLQEPIYQATRHLL